MKHNKEQKQLINEWLEKFNYSFNDHIKDHFMKSILNDFKKMNNLIDEELEVGKWYRVIGDDVLVVCITDIKDDEKTFYGIDYYGTWIEKGMLMLSEVEILEPATESYVIERLTSYFKKVISFEHENIDFYFIDDKGNFYVDFKDKGFKVLMKDGMWQRVEEPIKDKTISNIQKQLDNIKEQLNELKI